MAIDQTARGLAIKATTQYRVMPVASKNNLNKIVQYTGETTTDYINGYFYQVTKDGDNYVWVRKNIQPAGSAAGIQWGEITGNINSQTDLKNQLDAKQNKLVAGANITINAETNEISATDTKNYNDLTNIPSINNITVSGNKTLADLGLSNELKTINGESLLKTSSASNIAVKTYRPLKDEWKQNPAIYGGLTLAEFCGRINADNTVAIGDAYAGNIVSNKFFEGMYLEDPSNPLTSAEINVQILGNWGTGFVQLLSVTSSNHAPYYWQYTWVDGLANWVSWTDVRKLNSTTSTETLKYISLNGTEYKLPEGKTYTAGTNININENNVISATDTKYTAGTNVSINENNVISATNTTYTAGTNININENNVISATDTTYTAGENINITNNVISALAAKIGRNFTTDVTVGHLASGTNITADMTIADILYAMLVSNVIHVTSVSLNKNTLTLNKNTSETLIATVLPTNATNKNVTWSSSNQAIATVNNSGVVTGLTVGTCVITVTTVDGGFTANCNVTVQEASSLTVYYGGGGNEEEQEDPSESDLPSLESKNLQSESELIGQHIWKIVTGNAGNYSQYPTFVVPNTYEVTAWSTDAEGSYPVSAIIPVTLSNNRTMYYAPDPLYDFPDGTEHYITVIKK